MKAFLKGEKNGLLLLILSGLLFVLWARIVIFELNRGIYTHGLDTVIKRTECALHLGWEIDPGSEKLEQIKIPDEFNDVYKNYNKLQKKTGFDLSRYRGKTVSKYTYIILNPPENSKDKFYLNLLIYENSLIGGDTMTPSLYGFMLPLIRGK